MDERYKSFYEDHKKVFPKSVYTNVKNHREVLKNMDKIYEPVRRKALTSDSPSLQGKLGAMEMVMDGFRAHWLRSKKNKPESERRETLLQKRKQADVRKERVKDNKIKKTFKNRLKSLKVKLLSERGKGGGGDMNPSRVKPELVTPPKSLLQRN
tara:strand:+ start:247 stop:708 length:462 start_codon:yes stop_codon:yes gene_type:complete